MKFDDDGGWYYYRRYARDIVLTTKKFDGQNLMLIERSVPDSERAQVDLVIKKNVLVGTWTDLWKKQRPVLKVRLRPVNSSDLAGRILEWRTGDPYQDLKFDTLLKSGKLEYFKGIAFRWYLEPKSNVRFPRLEYASKAVNHALTAEHFDIAQEVLSCPGDFRYDATISFLSKRIFSVRGNMDYYCGGAYPDYGPRNYTLDLKTLQKPQFEDLYRFVLLPEGIDLESEEPFDKFISYKNVLGAKLRALLHWQYRNTLTKLSDGYCDEASNFQFPTWYLSRAGLVIQPSYAHVIGACQDDYTLPYKTIRHYLASNSPLK